MKNIGLKYGCIDIIVTPDNNYVFLEINPSGQWYFVQVRTEAHITKAIAKLIIDQ
jgi:glutathione synthase/RimK-type ligase-like ATP-grasp enzyme